MKPGCRRAARTDTIRPDTVPLVIVLRVIAHPETMVHPGTGRRAIGRTVGGHVRTGIRPL